MRPAVKNRAPVWIVAGLVLAWMLTKKKPAAPQSIVVGDMPWLNQGQKYFPPVEFNGKIYSTADGTNYLPVETLE